MRGPPRRRTVRGGTRGPELGVRGTSSDPSGRGRAYHPGMRHAIVPATFDELQALVRDLPEGYRGQILDGNVHVSPPPSAARAHTIAEISAMMVAGSPLGDPVPEGWAFQSGAEIACGAEAFLVADVAGFRVG